MAEKRETKKRKSETKPEPDENILVDAAKVIGAAAGKIASLAASVKPDENRPSQKKSKLVKKDRSRLPRRQMKAQQKAAAAKR